LFVFKIRETQRNKKKKKKKKSSGGSGRTMAGRSGVVRSILLVVYLFLLSSGKSLIFIFIFFFFNSFRLFHHPIFLFMAIKDVEKTNGDNVQRLNKIVSGFYDLTHSIRQAESLIRK
jgi:hypothetical protein